MRRGDRAPARTDHEPALRAKLLDAFTARWFASRSADAAAAAAAELCAVARRLLDEPGAPAAFPLPAEAPLARLLHDVLRGGEEGKAGEAPKARRQSAAAASGVKEVSALYMRPFCDRLTVASFVRTGSHKRCLPNRLSA